MVSGKWVFSDDFENAFFFFNFLVTNVILNNPNVPRDTCVGFKYATRRKRYSGCRCGTVRVITRVLQLTDAGVIKSSLYATINRAKPCRFAFVSKRERNPFQIVLWSINLDPS